MKFALKIGFATIYTLLIFFTIHYMSDILLKPQLVVTYENKIEFRDPRQDYSVLEEPKINIELSTSVKTLFGLLLLSGMLFGGIKISKQPSQTKSYILLTMAFLLLLPQVLQIFDISFSIHKQKTKHPNIHFPVYRPALEGRKISLLKEPSTLKITEHMPNLNGTAALYPLYIAFAQATYADNGDYHNVMCSNPSNAFSDLITGNTDLIFLMDISPDQEKKVNKTAITLHKIPIGKTAFIFVTDKKNPIKNLSVKDIQDIYSGKITNWKELGGKNVTIKPLHNLQDPESYTALMKIMQGIAIIETPEQSKKKETIDNNSTKEDITVTENIEGVITYCFLPSVKPIPKNMKIISINGSKPTQTNIKKRSYPLIYDFYAIRAEGKMDWSNVTISPHMIESIEKRYPKMMGKCPYETLTQFIDWLQSPQGQLLVEQAGYLPIAPTKK